MSVRQVEAVDRFEDALRRGLVTLGAQRSSVLLAVSGGGDSMALLVGASRLSGRLGLVLEVATFEHASSPAMATACARVEEECAARKIPCHRRALGLGLGPGFEGRARDAREVALQAVREDRNLEAIATAHTQNDQAETVLMRLARGSALGGAGGVLARRGRLIRPMLGVSREQARAYLMALGVGWVEDPMNDDLSLLRTRVRQSLLPAYEALAGPQVARHLAQFAQVAAEDDAWLEALAHQALERVSLPEGGLDAVAVRSLGLPVRRRVLANFLVAHQIVLDRTGLENALHAVQTDSVATLPGDRLLAVRAGRLAIEPAPSRNFK